MILVIVRIIITIQLIWYSLPGRLNSKKTHYKNSNNNYHHSPVTVIILFLISLTNYPSNLNSYTDVVYRTGLFHKRIGKAIYATTVL